MLLTFYYGQNKMCIRDRDGLAGRVTLLPYSALGTGRGLIAALRPDSVSVDGEPADILIGLSPAPLSGDGEFDAIL